MRKSDIIGLVLLAFVIGCRVYVPLADFYSLRCYPVISSSLSLVASAVPVSLEEVVVIGFVLAFIAIIVRTVRRREGFFRWLAGTARVAMWLVIWLYMGWGNNYFRTPLYSRLSIEKAAYSYEEFSRFLADYTESLNVAAGTAASCDRDALETDVKEYYSSVVSNFGYTGLRKWQHIKKPIINPLYSSVGVLGFMGPFFCESQLNLELLDVEYPFTMAHELAHLAGVTSEAEANYWAFNFCRQSDNAAVRYSGYLSIMPYFASNARSLLPEDVYAEWLSALSEKAKQDYAACREYWDVKRIRLIDNAQRWMMDRFLKTNGVANGASDYVGVVGMIITMDSYSCK
ncbi:MAG: DUF3810 domain-containing protein [Bacteroidales bacterium]|nr:DUF3810 domain-containing protein [Bacteroidales bacterium]